MKEIKNIKNHLKDAPRPIYLIGNAEYKVSNGEHILLTKAIFPTSEPSIKDRWENHLFPHVNIGNAYFSFWNGVYVICDMLGYHGTITRSGNHKVSGFIPADTEVDLELTIKNFKVLEKGIFEMRVDYEAFLKYKSKILMEAYGNGYAVKK